MTEMNFFEGFAWAVPTAFSDAIFECRFELGDILYDTKKAYEKWNTDNINWIIQVTYSDRSMIKLEEDEKAIFKQNWKSTVHLELTDVKNGFNKKQITTTQGRLYTLLWLGDIDVLDTNNPSPDIPLGLPYIRKEINKVNYDLKKYTTDEVENPNIFIMPINRANKEVVQKYIKLLNILKTNFNTLEYELYPKDLNIENSGNILPSIIIKYLIMDSGKIEEIRDFMKEFFWVTTKKSIRKIFDSIVDRKDFSSVHHFKLKRYGVFIPYKDKGAKHGVIKVRSFGHTPFYRYRVHMEKLDEINKKARALGSFIKNLFNNCPNHLFVDNEFRCSGLNGEIDIDIKHSLDHELSFFARESCEIKEYKSRHENLQKYFLENEPCSFACEVPVWLESRELNDYSAIFKTEQQLTGHIDLLRFIETGEKDYIIEVLDYKPNASSEIYAKTQVFLYAFIMSVRTGIQLSKFKCGYFDEQDTYYFNPSEIKNYDFG